MNFLEMLSYYFGVDEFDSIIGGRKQCNVPHLVEEDFDRAVLGLEMCLLRKLDHSWIARGFGFSSPTTIFPANLKISQVELCKSVAFGLSVDNSVLYSIDLNVGVNTNSDSVSSAITQVIPQLQPQENQVSSLESSKLIQIVSNDSNVFALSDRSEIYMVPNLLFRLSDTMKITKIACGFDHHLILTDTGAVYSWGNGSRGQLGFTDIEIKCDVPRRVEFFDDLPCTVVDIVAGGWHTLALTSDGDIYSWGWNQASQCGHSSDQLSTVIREPYPVDLGSGDNPVTKIGAGARHSVAILKNGDIFSWGWNKYGQLGLGDNEDRPNPTQVKCKEFDAKKPGSVNCGRWGTLVQCSSAVTVNVNADNN